MVLDADHAEKKTYHGDIADVRIRIVDAHSCSPRCAENGGGDGSSNSTIVERVACYGPLSNCIHRERFLV